MKMPETQNKEYWKNKFEENPRLRLVLYVAGAILAIWVFGKAAKLLSDAMTNFKNLKNAIQR